MSNRTSMDNTATINYCVKCTRKIGWIGLFNSIVLTIFKGTVGIFARSHGLLASALYSVHDIFSSIAVLIGLKVAANPVDKKYPYGYGNIEYIVSVFASIFLLIATIYLTYKSATIFFSVSINKPPHWAAMVAGIISFASNEMIYNYHICSFKHTNSPAILLHSKHAHADALSSLAVGMAILGTMMGIPYLDPLVALFEAGHLIYTSVEILYHSSKGLMDHTINDNDVDSINSLLSDFPEIMEVTRIRSRQIGRKIWAELYLSFPHDKTIVELDGISRRIKKDLPGRMKHLGGVEVIYV